MVGYTVWTNEKIVPYKHTNMAVYTVNENHRTVYTILLHTPVSLSLQSRERDQRGRAGRGARHSQSRTSLQLSLSLERATCSELLTSPPELETLSRIERENREQRAERHLSRERERQRGMQCELAEVGSIRHDYVRTFYVWGVGELDTAMQLCQTPAQQCNICRTRVGTIALAATYV